MHHLEGGEAGMVAGRNRENCGDVASAETGYLFQNSSQSLSEVNSREHPKPQTTNKTITLHHIVSQQNYCTSILPSLL